MCVKDHRGRDDYDAFLERRERQDLPGPVIGDWAQPPAGGGVGDDVHGDLPARSSMRISRRAGGLR
ncbi:MAG: hypothetical protein CME15_07925 [Gemmatimonadetes bacterium]|nr:hypothetical protein [Gemmatimonadota bacterium]